MINDCNEVEILKHIDKTLEGIENRISREPRKSCKWQDSYTAKFRKR